MFPQGGPGVALLLLRTSVAAIFLISVAKRFGVSSAPLIFAISSLVSICLVIGFLTPYLSVVAFVTALASFLIGPTSRDLIHVFPIIDAAVLAQIGRASCRERV